MSDSDLEAYYNECNERSSSNDDLLAADWHSGPAVSPVRGGARSLTPSRIRGAKGKPEHVIHRSAFASNVAAHLTSVRYPPHRTPEPPTPLRSDALRHLKEVETLSHQLVGTVKQACTLTSHHPSWGAVRACIGSIVEDIDAGASPTRASRVRIELAEKLRWVCNIYIVESSPVDCLLLRALRAEEECDSSAFSFFTSFFIVALYPHLHGAFNGDADSLPVFLREICHRPNTEGNHLPSQYVRSMVLGVLNSWCKPSAHSTDLAVPADTEASVLQVAPRHLTVEFANMLGVCLSAPYQQGAKVHVDQQEGLMDWLRRTLMAPLKQLTSQLDKAAVHAVHTQGGGSKRVYTLLRDVLLLRGLDNLASKLLETRSLFDSASINEMGEGCNTANQALSALFSELVGPYSSMVQLVVLPSPAKSASGSAKVLGLLKAVRLTFSVGQHQSILTRECAQAGNNWRHMTSPDPFSALFSSLLAFSIVSECNISKWKSLAKESMGTMQHTLCCVRHLVRACVDYVASECNTHLDRFKKLTMQATSITHIERAAQEMSESVRRTLFLTDGNLRLSDAFSSLVSCMLRSVLDDYCADIDEAVVAFVTEAEHAPATPALRHLVTQITFNHYFTS